MQNRTRILQLALVCLVAITFIVKLQTFIMDYSGRTKNAAVTTEKTAGEADNQNTKPAQDTNIASADNKSTDSTNAGASETAEVISDGAYPIIGPNGVTVDQMVKYFESSGYKFPSADLEKGGAASIQDYCQIFYEEAAAEGVRVEIPYVQSMKETGWLQFQGVCDIAQYNFAGMGATGGNEAGVSYPDVRTGIRAQIQHLKAYATGDALINQCVDERYSLVTKASAPYVQWLGQQENPGGYGWATDGGYGISIVEMIQTLKSF